MVWAPSFMTMTAGQISPSSLDAVLLHGGSRFRYPGDRVIHLSSLRAKASLSLSIPGSGMIYVRNGAIPVRPVSALNNPAGLRVSSTPLIR